MIALRLLLLFVVAIASAADGQTPRDWSRLDRVVLYSPHFDVVPEPYGGLSCPAQPLRLYGFESPATDTTATLLVRLFGPADPRTGMPRAGVPGHPIRLTRRWADDRFVDLPDSPTWRVFTDSLGGAELRVPPGIYELEIRTGSPIGRGIIQVRPSRRDSLHVHILPRALC
jgi:hypothetical protein